MSSHDLETALRDIGSDASGSRLCTLISTATLSGKDKDLPGTAEHYLRAFCNGKHSVLQRRWIGLALASMMNASASVVDHLSRTPRDLHRLGRIILQHDEPEELKIMAGLLMQLGVDNGIALSGFWASDKVKNSLPPFPHGYNPRWMLQFGNFLKGLDDLKLGDTTTDDTIVFPVAVLDSDGFKWGHTDFAMAIGQRTHLTIITPDFTLKEYHFIDIPLSHVLSVTSHLSSPFNSQPEHRNTNPKLYIIEFVLQSESWTYRLNSSEHTANRITLQFTTNEEAMDLQNCILEYQREATRAGAVQPPTDSAPAKDTSASNSQPRRLRSSSPKPNQDHDALSATRPSPRRTHLRSSHRSDPIDISRPRSTRSTKQVDKPSQPYEDDSQILVEESYPLAYTMQAQGLQQLDSPEPARPASSNGDNPDRSIETGVLGEARDEDSTSRPTTAEGRKGKLPKVSRAAKVNAIQPRQKRTQEPDVTQGRATRQSARQAKAASSDRSDNGSPPPQKPQAKSNTASCNPTTANKGRKAQTRRKAEDGDDEFVPNQPSPKTKKADKRKRASGAANDDEQPKKKTRAGPASAPMSSPVAKPRARKTEPLHREGPELPLTQKEAKTQGTKQKPTEARPSSMPPPRNTLIGGLVGSQRSPKVSTAAPRGPVQSAWANQTPSTPTKSHKSRPVSRNSFEIQKLTAQSPAHVASSPIVGSSVRGDRSLTRQAFADMEILSSNTKRGPASPHAESTAISGHADRDQVDMEKEMADHETARSDPFKCRSDRNKVTTFIRRLTSEQSVVEDVDVPEEPASTLPAELDYDDMLEDDFAPKVAESLLSQRPPIMGIKRRIGEVEQPNEQPVGRSAKPSSLTGVKNSAREQPRTTPAKVPQPTHGELPSKLWSPSKATQNPHATSGKSTPGRKVTTAKGLAKSMARLREQQPRVFRGQTAETNTPDQQYESDESAYVEGDTTLVNDEDDINPDLQFLSSPPVPWSSGSHSSTSADPDLTPGPSPPTSQMEELEWEASLRPEQRPLHGLLMRVSKKVLQSVFNNESTVSDIAEEFSRDGQHLVDSMLEQHGAQYAGAFEDLEEKKEALRKELEAATRALVEERAQVHATD